MCVDLCTVHNYHCARMSKELTYIEVGAELGVHPYHVRRLVRKHPRIIRPIVHGYNRITFRIGDVKKLKAIRQSDAIKSRQAAIKKMRKLSKLRRAA